VGSLHCWEPSCHHHHVHHATKHIHLASLAVLTLFASCSSPEVKAQSAPRDANQGAVAVAAPAANAPARKGEVFGKAPMMAQPVAAATVMTNVAN